MAPPSAVPPPGPRTGEIVRLGEPLPLAPLENGIGLRDPLPGSGSLFDVSGVNALAGFGAGVPSDGAAAFFGQTPTLDGLFGPEFSAANDPLLAASSPDGALASGGDWLLGQELTCHERRWDRAPTFSIGTESLGLGALHFLGYRAGVGLMARNPTAVQNFFRGEFGESNFRRIEFLFSDSDVSRARIQEIRNQIAERAGHRYTNLESLQNLVNSVLKEEGIDIEAWRRERPSDHLDAMSDDVLRGVLLVQLLPDEVPLFRSTEPFRADQADPGGSSYWGVGSEGMDVASSYMAPGRIFTRTTVGDLRRAGVIRTDEVAVTGNALELYHGNLPGSEDRFTTIAYTQVEAPVSLAR